MNWFACYLAISCCNKFSIFFVFNREPGQNVRCHKFGGLCTLQISIIVKYSKLFSAKRSEKIRKIKYIARYTFANFCHIFCLNTWVKTADKHVASTSVFSTSPSYMMKYTGVIWSFHNNSFEVKFSWIRIISYLLNVENSTLYTFNLFVYWIFGWLVIF